MDFTYLEDIVEAIEPILTRALPVVGTSLILGRLLSIIKR